MAKRWTKGWLRDYEIPRLEKVLRSGDLASVEEIKALADQYQGGTFADYAEWCRKLSTFARRQEWHARFQGDEKTADIWELAQVALEDRAEVVDLSSIGQRVKVTPASRARIDLIEDCDWMLLQLAAARLALKRQTEEGQRPKDLDELLGRIRAEIGHVRAILFGEVVAPTPSPADSPVDWADKITPLEEAALLRAYHTVNTDILKRLRPPVSPRDKSPYPPTWSALFESVAWQHNKYPAHVIRDWSLVAICAANVVEVMKHDAIERDAKRKKAH